jgi:hypothetical protein
MTNPISFFAYYREIARRETEKSKSKINLIEILIISKNRETPN